MHPHTPHPLFFVACLISFPFALPTCVCACVCVEQQLAVWGSTFSAHKHTRGNATHPTRTSHCNPKSNKRTTTRKQNNNNKKKINRGGVARYCCCPSLLRCDAPSTWCASAGALLLIAVCVYVQSPAVHRGQKKKRLFGCLFQKYTCERHIPLRFFPLSSFVLPQCPSPGLHPSHHYPSHYPLHVLHQSSPSLHFLVRFLGSRQR